MNWKAWVFGPPLLSLPLALLVLWLGPSWAQPATGLVVGINDPRFAESYPAVTLNTLNVDQVAIGVSLQEPATSYPGNGGALAAGRTARKAGIGAVFHPASGPTSSWAIPPSMGVLIILGGDHWYELHPAAYAVAALRLVRAHPNVRELQVWNEPDLCDARYAWSTCLTIPDLRHRFAGAALDYYLNELAATHDALVGTGVKVLGFGFSPPFRRMGNRTYSWWTPEEIAAGIDSWYSRRGGRRCVGTEAGQCISVRGLRYSRPIMDGFAYHPYNGWTADETNRIHDALAAIDLPGGTPDLWWTEFGLSTRAVTCTCEWQGSETDQATRINTVLGAARRSPYVAGAFNFLLRDEAAPGVFQTGLLHPDGSLKPAFAAFEAQA